MKVRTRDVTFVATVPAINSTSQKKGRAQAVFDTDTRVLVIKTSKGAIRLIPAERLGEIEPIDPTPYLAMFEEPVIVGKPQPVTKDMKPAPKVSA